ncbi:MAG: hypothetical protein IJ811_00950 [Clostridia bacterium]|nr:hypothetical protein [Clostridia bacterium]
MGERFTEQRCRDCQGGLVYNKQEKYWECPYCGKIYERELRFNKVQIDGLAGINDLVRSTLTKIADLDFDGAEKDLNECKKVDYANFGTVIAEIALTLFKTFFSKDRSQDVAKLNLQLSKFERDFPKPTAPEEILYDFINSADLYGLLAVVYGTTGQTGRFNAMCDMMLENEVYNDNVIRYLIPVMLKNGRVTEADDLIGNVTAVNARQTLSAVLSDYPSLPKKSEYVQALLQKIDLERYDLSKQFDGYFNGTEDADSVVVSIFLSAINVGIKIETLSIIRKVLSRCENEQSAEIIFSSLSASRLDQQTAQIVYEWCAVYSQSTKVCTLGLQALKNSGSMFEATYEDLLRFLLTDQDEQIKFEKLTAVYDTFNVSGKNNDRTIENFLLRGKGQSEFRVKVCEFLLEKTPSAQLSTVEKYVLTCANDGENKPLIMRTLFEKVRSATVFSGTFSRYLQTDIDDSATREAVIKLFLDSGVTPDAGALSYYLINDKELRSDCILEAFMSAGCRTLSSAFDDYLFNLNDYSKYRPSIAKICTQGSFKISADNYLRYVLYVTCDGDKAKNASAFLKATNEREVAQKVVSAKINGEQIGANVAQIYLLTTKDAPSVIVEVVKALSAARIKLDAPIEDRGANKKIKLRKFIESNQSALRSDMTSIAKQLKI